MSVRSLSLLLGVIAGSQLCACWMNDALDPGYTAAADAERGQRLFRSNCARTCHPANAFDVLAVKDQRRLIATVRSYYESVVGGEGNYTPQDVYDLARYLDRKYYRFPAGQPQNVRP